MATGAGAEKPTLNTRASVDTLRALQQEAIDYAGRFNALWREFDSYTGVIAQTVEDRNALVRMFNSTSDRFMDAMRGFDSWLEREKELLGIGVANGEALADWRDATLAEGKPDSANMITEQALAPYLAELRQCEDLANLAIEAFNKATEQGKAALRSIDNQGGVLREKERAFWTGPAGTVAATAGIGAFALLALGIGALALLSRR